MGILTITYSLLFVVDFLPEAPSEESKEVVETTVEPQEIVKEAAPIDPEPITVIFDTLDKELVVLNPESNAISDLDAALLNGVVRHPDSADFEREGTIVLFGHSSYLPQVINKSFQAFNGIQKLEWGDTVRLQSSDKEYVYRVDKVYEAKASKAEVEIVSGTAKLTLVTCNSFGSRDDRYIVEATLIDSYEL
jgi:LPXTG-site transpeptidase (sortase) family protein